MRFVQVYRQAISLTKKRHTWPRCAASLVLLIPESPQKCAQLIICEILGITTEPLQQFVSFSPHVFAPMLQLNYSCKYSVLYFDHFDNRFSFPFYPFLTLWLLFATFLLDRPSPVSCIRAAGSPGFAPPPAAAQSTACIPPRPARCAVPFQFSWAASVSFTRGPGCAFIVCWRAGACQLKAACFHKIPGLLKES